jgi:predicted component of type VI protein secretion system
LIDPKTGDLQLKARDFTTVRGSLNIEQAARNRLTTRQGETPILDGYGLPQRIGERITAESAGYLSAHIREQLTRDPRLESVNVIELSDKGDHLSASVEFRAIAGAVFSERIVI